MKSKREVILHIGTPKTGTTALQLAFYKSLDQLSEKGISYPNLTQSGHGWTIERGLGSGNANVHAIVPWESNVAEARFSELVRKAFRECPASNSILLSSEILNGYVSSSNFWKTIDELSLEFEARFRIVVYLRDPFNWFVATYQQAVKASGFKGNLDDFVVTFLNSKSDLSFGTQQNLSAIIERSKSSNCEIEIYRYEDSLPSIESHFFSNVLGLDFDSFGISRSKVNTTFNMMELEFHRGINTVSKHLGTLLSFERSDTAMAKDIKRFDFSESKFPLSLESRKTLETAFNQYRETLSRVCNFADKVDFTIDASRLTFELDESEDQIRQQIFELGRFVAISYSSGYMKWDWNKQEKKKLQSEE